VIEYTFGGPGTDAGEPWCVARWRDYLDMDNLNFNMQTVLSTENDPAFNTTGRREMPHA
jgi:hypothetical protein